MKADIDHFADLIRRVPFLAVDLDEARRSGDHVAIAYANAVTAWQREAAQALLGSERPGIDPPDAYDRMATAAALLRLEAAE